MQNICLGCMKDIEEGVTVCPHCGYHDDGSQKNPYLATKTILKNGTYLVGKLLTANGEGNTYMAYDGPNRKPVLVREFLPIGLCGRGEDKKTVVPVGDVEFFNICKEKFVSVARSLARMNDLSAILPVLDIFEDNGTVYYVTDYVVNITLEEFLKKNGNKLTWEQTKTLMLPVLSDLQTLHLSDVLHRGISPKTIIVGRDGKLRLTGFCIPDVRTARSDLESELFAGYSAVEQYGFDAPVTEATDIYSFAAVVYRMLTGINPPDSTSRVSNDTLTIPNDLVQTLPRYVLMGLANALQILPQDRTRTASEMHSELANVTAKAKKPEVHSQKTQEPEEEPEEKKNSSAKTIVISLVCTAVVLGLIVWILFATVFKSSNKNQAEEFSAPETSTVVASNVTTNAVVPDLAGLSYVEAVNAAGNKFEIIVKSKEYSETVAKGKIISQDPVKDEVIKTHENGELNKINVVISLGASKGKMPNVSGMSYEEAFVELVKAGFAPENISKGEKYSNEAAGEKVVDTSPVAGTTDVNYESAVTIFVNTKKDETSSQTSKDTSSKTTSSKTASQTSSVVSKPVVNSSTPESKTTSTQSTTSTTESKTSEASTASQATSGVTSKDAD